MQIFAPPANIEAPELHTQPGTTTHETVVNYGNAIKAYVGQIKEYCNKHGRGKYKGSEVRFPVGDGHAVYYVVSISPLVLIHDQSGDAYSMPYIDRLTAKDIKQAVESQKAFDALFK